MGHGVKAALLATLVASLRNGRRANEAMMAHAEEDHFVTGLLLRVDLHTGRIACRQRWPPTPYRLRDGRVECLEMGADIPFGMMEGSSYREQELYLRPGARLAIVTDGLVERPTPPAASMSPPRWSR